MNGKKVTCVIAALWALFVVMPMWFAIVFGVLLASNAAGWTWGLFYAYVPVQIVGCLLSVIAGLLSEDE